LPRRDFLGGDGQSRRGAQSFAVDKYIFKLIANNYIFIFSKNQGIIKRENDGLKKINFFAVAK